MTFGSSGEGARQKESNRKKEIPSFLLSSANATKKVSLSLFKKKKKKKKNSRQASARECVCLCVRVLYISRECAFLFCVGDWKKK